jgi:hypothetical protein
LKAWAAANQDATIAVLVIYEYKDNTTQIPSGYRFYVASSDGKYKVATTWDYAKFDQTPLDAGKYKLTPPPNDAGTGK